MIPSRRLRVLELGAGMHPDERIYALNHADGQILQTFAWLRQVNGAGLEVSIPLGRRDDGAVLVELPQETCCGAWRVWVGESELS